MSEEKFFKAYCKKCGGKIEFPGHAMGVTIACPHCGKDTILSAPQAAPVAAAPAAPPAKVGSAADAIAAAQQKKEAAKKEAPKQPPAKEEPPKKEAPKSPPKQGDASKAPPKRVAPKGSSIASPLDDLYDQIDKAKNKATCPSCEARIEQGLKVCPSCGAALVKHVRFVRRWGGLTLVVLIIAFPFLLPRSCKLPVKKLEDQRSKFVKPARPDIEALNPVWTKAKEGSVQSITGQVVNNSDTRYIAVKVEFELLDKNGTVLGTTIDQVAGIEPKKTWAFKAVAIDPDAVSFKFVKLSGEKVAASPPPPPPPPAKK
jgi:predicted RNA-binding Zn-ribbon protein involved in translation (DUF1610 family)